MRDQCKICRQMKGSQAEHQELWWCRGAKMLAVPGGRTCCFPNQEIPLECYDPEVLEPVLSPKFSKYSQINRTDVSLILLSLSEAKILQEIVSLYSSISEVSLCAGLILWERQANIIRAADKSPMLQCRLVSLNNTSFQDEIACWDPQGWECLASPCRSFWMTALLLDLGIQSSLLQPELHRWATL